MYETIAAYLDILLYYRLVYLLKNLDKVYRHKQDLDLYTTWI